MLLIASTLITAFSLGLYIMAVNFYINLHLGHEFLSISVALGIASLLISIATYKKFCRTNINLLAVVSLCSLVASGYLLYLVSYTSVASYIIALLCIIVPIASTGAFILRNYNVSSVKSGILVIAVGFFLAMVAAFWIVEWKGGWMVFMASSVFLILSSILHVKISKLLKASVIVLFVGLLFTINASGFNERLASWSLDEKPVTKDSLNLLNNPEKRGWVIEETIWKKGHRTDVVSTNRSRKEGYFWAIYDANIQVPYVDKAHSTVPWWGDHYPLTIIPFELKKPSSVLTVAPAIGGDAAISKQLYSAETTSVYDNCIAVDGYPACNDLPLNVQLEDALNKHGKYDLISFSIFSQVATPYVGVSASYEFLHTTEVFQKLYNSLNDDGLLAINSRDQVMLHKALSYVWRVMSDNDQAKIINFGNHIRILTLNKYSLKNDAYNYLVLVSKSGFSADELDKIDNFLEAFPVTKVIYDSVNNIAPYGFFRQLNTITISSAISHLTKASSWKFKKLLNLERSNINKPDFYNLSRELHPFVAALSAIFLFFGIYGLIFSHNDARHLRPDNFQRAPALSILLFQPLLIGLSLVLLLYCIASFMSSSLGYSSQYTAVLLFSSFLAFGITYGLNKTSGEKSKGKHGAWLYAAILLMCILILLLLSKIYDFPPGFGIQLVMLVVAVVVAFVSGLAHRQSALFLKETFPEVWFWFWGMTSVGVISGTIVARYILIDYTFDVMVLTAMAIVVFTGFIAWWCTVALQEKIEVR